MKKEHKKLFNLKTSRVLATAIAAVTTSLLTAKITSTLNSIIALAIVSIISTLSIEVYDRVIHGTTKIAAKTAALIPYEKILPDTIASNINNKIESALEDTTEQIEPVTVTPDGDIIEPKTDDKTVPVGDTPADEVATTEVVEEASNDEHSKKVAGWMQTLLLFIVIALLTIGMTALASHWFEKPSTTTNVYPKTSLSQSDTKSLLDSASGTADQKVNAKTRVLQSQLDSINGKIDDMQSQMSALQSSNSKPTPAPSQASPSPSPSTSTSNSNTDKELQADETKISNMQQTITDLQAQVKSLQTQINELNQSNQNNQPNK